MEHAILIPKLVEYDPASGALTYRRAEPWMFSSGMKSAEHNCAVWNAKNAGCRALSSLHREGYRAGSILGRKFLAHRVAWLISHGGWPEAEVDHINHDRSDNRLANLRAVTRHENARNLSRQASRCSGHTGVYWYAPTSRWVAKINVSGRMLHLGYFLNEAEAVSARKEAEQLHGFHQNHGRTF